MTINEIKNTTDTLNFFQTMYHIENKRKMTNKMQDTIIKTLHTVLPYSPDVVSWINEEITELKKDFESYYVLMNIIMEIDGDNGFIGNTDFNSRLNTLFWS